MENVYEGQIVGQIFVKMIYLSMLPKQKMSNMCAGSDDKIILTPLLDFSLEEYMEYIGEDEYLEITPKSLRLRKILNETDRKRVNKQ